MVSYFFEKIEKENGSIGYIKIVITERARRHPSDEYARRGIIFRMKIWGGDGDLGDRGQGRICRVRGNDMRGTWGTSRI